MKAVLTGGGTGGHIFPLVSVVRDLRIESKDPIDFLYIGPNDNFSKEAFEKENIPMANISAGKIRRYFSFASFLNNLYDLFIAIPKGFIQSFSLLRDFKPDFVFSKGGYGSVPVVLMAKVLGIPIYLHESDSVPGLANRVIAVFAKQIFISYSRTASFFPDYKSFLTGNPIRSNVKRQYDLGLKKVFGLKGGKSVLLVLGGSQGSVRLNNLIVDNLDYLLEKFEIIHQTGRADYERVMKTRDNCMFKGYYHVYDFFDEQKMSIALSFADCCISRSGSSSVTELAAVGVPAILIPLPESAQNHQLGNALAYYEETESCIIIEEKDLTLKKLKEALEEVMKLGDTENRQKMSVFSRKNASKMIAKKILEEIK